MQHNQHPGHSDQNHYLRFVGMIVLSFISMYGLMYSMANSVADVYNSLNHDARIQADRDRGTSRTPLAGGQHRAGDNGEPMLHAHVVVGKSDGTAHGGHLLEASVRPTMELIIMESSQHLRRRMREDVGAALLDLSD